MKQLEKQSMKDLIKYALDMPAGDLATYGTLFMSGPVPDRMTRAELIALQLVDQAAHGDLAAIRELRTWIVDDPKAPQGGTNYYQYLIQLSGEDAKSVDPKSIAPNLAKLTQIIETQVLPPSPSPLDDL